MSASMPSPSSSPASPDSHTLRLVLTGVQLALVLPMSYLIWRTVGRLHRLRREAL